MSDETIRRDIFWNTLGSLAYALSSFVLSFLAIRFAGAGEGGIFAFGYSTLGQQMFIIAYFGIRPFHITDVSEQYAFSDYRKARIRTCALAVLCCIAYLFLLTAAGKYSLHKAEVLFFLALYKIEDGYADLLESECQRKGVLWRGGRELFLRVLTAGGLFAVLMAAERQILPAAAAAVVFQGIFLVIFFRNLRKDGVIPGWEPEGNDGSRLLLKNTVYLFLGVFLDFLIFSSSRYAVDLMLNDTASGVFNLLFMPTSFIYLAANFIMKPYLTRMAALYSGGRENAFRRMKRFLMLFTAGLTLFAVAGAAVLGKPVMKLAEQLSGSIAPGELSGRIPEFTLILFGGGLYAAANLFYYLLVIQRKQKVIFRVYALTLAAAVILAPVLTGRFGLAGASVSYTLLMLILCLVFYRISRESFGQRSHVHEENL